MTNGRQAAFISGLIENAPTVLFFLALYAFGDMRLAGWIAGPAAAMICAGYLSRRLRPNTIMLGVNLYFVAGVCAAEILLLLGQRDMALAFSDNALSLVLTATFLVGCILTLVSRQGFVGHEFETRAATRKASLLLLGVNLTGMLWAASVDAERLVKVGLPLLVLFGAQRFLIARALDSRRGPMAGALAAAGEPNDGSAELT